MDTQTMLHIIKATGTPQTDLSINLDSQKVFSRREGRRPKIVNRTVYRVRFDENNRLIGNLIQTSGDEPRPQYVYDFERRSWQRDAQRDVLSINR